MAVFVLQAVLSNNSCTQVFWKAIYFVLFMLELWYCGIWTDTFLFQPRRILVSCDIGGLIWHCLPFHSKQMLYRSDKWSEGAARVGYQFFSQITLHGSCSSWLVIAALSHRAKQYKMGWWIVQQWQNRVKFTVLSHLIIDSIPRTVRDVNKVHPSIHPSISSSNRTKSLTSPCQYSFVNIPPF